MTLRHKCSPLLEAGGIAAAVLATGILAGCGASGHGHAASGLRPAPAPRSVLGISEEGNPPGSVTTRPTTADPDAQVGLPSGSSSELKGLAATYADQPCRLVTQAEAESILGGPIAPPHQAPLGPTCVYIHGLATISLSVEAFSYSSVSGRLQKVDEASTAGHAAYCAVLGQPLLLAPISAGSTLEIVGPCPIARGFAAAALPRLSDA